MGNSWQQPVTGEPNWGEPHAHVETIVNAANPASTSTYEVTVTNVPQGTKAIAGYTSMLSSNAGRLMNIKSMAGDTWVTLSNPTNAIYGYSWFEVPLDSSKKFYYEVTSADVSAVNIYLREYFL